MSEEIKIIELKELDNALDLLMDFNREIKIYKTEEEMILQRKRDLKRLCSMLPRIMFLQLSFMKVAVLNIPAKAK